MRWRLYRTSRALRLLNMFHSAMLSLLEGGWGVTGPRPGDLVSSGDKGHCVYVSIAAKIRCKDGILTLTTHEMTKKHFSEDTGPR